MSRFLVATFATLAALAAAGSAGGVSSYVIQGDNKIGGYAVKTDGTLAGAFDEFGSPSVQRRSARGCQLAWRALGLQAQFYNLAGKDPCAPGAGHFGRATITGRRWRTSRGLSIGDPAVRVRRVHPNARFHRDRFYGAGWWLVTRTTPLLDAPFPGLLARVSNGHVSALVVRYAAGGD